MKELDDKILKDYLLGKCSPDEASKILEWMQESEDHAEHLFKLEELYHLGRYAKYEDPKRAEKAEQRLMSRIDEIEESHHPRFNFIRLMKYAAIIAVVVVAGGIGYQMLHKSPAEEMLTAQANNGVKQVTLPDGTKVWLNQNTTLKYPTTFNADERNVSLQGEAYFEVTKNPHQPFIVEGGAMKVKVLGTVFNFNTRCGNNKEEVALLEGKVQASSDKAEGNYVITPGQKVVLDTQLHKMEIKEVNADLDAVWHNHLIPLKNVNVKDIAQILKRFYRVDFSFASDIDMNMTYSGVIKQSSSIDSVLSALTYTVPIRYTIKGNHVYLANKR